MKIQKTSVSLLSIAVGISVLVIAVPALARGIETKNNTTGSTTNMMRQKSIGQSDQKMGDRANKEIDRRIKALSGLVTKIQSMNKVSSTTQAMLVSEVRVEITNLTALKAKI